MPRWLFAVSGGPDSMVALHMNMAKAKCVCHVNYQSRPTADRDERIVQEFCAAHGIRFYALRVKRADGDGNFQHWARTVRYGFFVAKARENDCDTIVTGHTMDDFLETAVMQSERGGPRLFFGIPEHSSYGGIDVFRPNIGITKQEVLAYADANGVHYGVDESNVQPVYVRNRVRQQLGLLTREQRAAAVASFEQVNAVNAARRKAVPVLLGEWRKAGLQVRFFKERIDEEMREYIVYALLREEGIPITSSAKTALLANFILRGKGGAALRLGHGWAITKQGGQVVLSRQTV